MASYATAEWTKLIIEQPISSLTITAHLINSSSTNPVSGSGKQYFDDIAADEANTAAYASQSLTAVTASLSGSKVILTCDDILFASASVGLGVIRALAFKAHVTNNADSPICVIDLAAIPTGSRIPDAVHGIEFTCGDGGFLVYQRSGSV